jgi:hypothetical protein
MLRRGCRLQANKASARKTNHYALGCMRARRRVELYVIGGMECFSCGLANLDASEQDQMRRLLTACIASLTEPPVPAT